MSVGNRRLRPGEFDGLVLAHLREHKKDSPLTATTVANCLSRLAKDKKVRQVEQAPPAYWTLRAASAPGNRDPGVLGLAGLGK